MNLNFGALVAPANSEFISDERNYENPQIKRIGFLIGVNLIDVIKQDDGKFGDGGIAIIRPEELAKLGGTDNWQ